MVAYNFEYDGIRLSDVGYTICNFGSGGLDTVTNGSELSFKTTSTLNGTKQELASYEYDECVSVTFDICKDVCDADDFTITVPEFRHLMRWLNRKRYHKFKIIDDDWRGLWWEGSFNVNRIEFQDHIVGAELTFTANRPFAMMEEVLLEFSGTSNNWTYQIKDFSDEEGFVYPHTEITINSTGNLNIYNDIEDRDVYIAGCSNGEIITMDYPIITTSSVTHEIQNDFNWNFFRIANTFGERDNNLTISLPCSISLSYYPVAKMGL